MIYHECAKLFTSILNDFLCRTLQMLASIENRMEELFETIESLPADKIEAAEKVGHYFIPSPHS